MFWTPPKMWEGRDVFILGGGPSVRDLDLSLLRGQRVIGINQAFELGACDICFFGDYRWFEWNLEELRSYTGLIVTCCDTMAKEPEKKPRWVKLLQRINRFGICQRADSLFWNTNSGATAIGLAHHLGAKRIILLGFDMKQVEGAPNGGNNWHDKHARFFTPRKGIFNKFQKPWPAIKHDAERLNIEIINATEGSALTVFPHQPLAELVK